MSFHSAPRGRPAKAVAGPPPEEAAARLFLQRRGYAVYTAAIADYPDRTPRRDERDIIRVGDQRMSRAGMMSFAGTLGFTGRA